MSTVVNSQVQPRLREGSPWTGLWAVVAKEMADHLTSARMRILEVLIVLTAAGSVYAAMSNIRQTIGQDPFLFLYLFTTSKDPLPPFIGFLIFLVPLIAISIAFDSVNGEFSRRTMSRVLAQPIYRDALLMGKFLAGLFTQTLVFTVIWLLVIGLGIVGLGLPPSSEEVARIFLFLLATIFYGGIWLAVGMVFSTVFRQPATAALTSIAVWLFYTIFWEIIVRIVTQVVVFLAQAFSPAYYASQRALLVLANNVAVAMSRLSPNFLYSQVMTALLEPKITSTPSSFAALYYMQQSGMVIGAPLPLSQSLLLTWPEFTGLIAATLLLFALGYTLFQRQEIRA